MTRLHWLSLAVLALGCHADKRAPVARGHDGYRIHQDVALHATGFDDAHLQILEDARIAPSIRAAFQRGVPDDSCASASSDSLRAFCSAIAQRPLHPALVRLVSANDVELDTAALERPIADVMLVIPAAGSEPTLYGVSVDLTADMGTYSGPFVRLLDSRSRRLSWVKVHDVSSDSTVELVLPTTPKSAWKSIARTDATGNDIFLIACRPTLAASDTVGFEVTYSRVSFVAGEWQRYRRIAKGCWENEGDFPARSEFP